jgi:hypothetical protein
MAQLAIAAIGSAIGSYIVPGTFLGLTGASIGWTVGSIIGAQFGPRQRASGPRLEDLKVTGVEYGQAIPWVAGHPRTAGQIWWASEKREIATTTEVGKGGGGAEYTEYTYEVDLLIGLCDREITAISRVWSNGKLVWTALDTSDDASLVNSQREAPWTRITAYTGASDQLPDPTYETAVGATNAPAYRGRGSVFIEGLQLGSSGQLPNLTFEVAVGGSIERVCLGWSDDLLLLLCFEGTPGTTGAAAAIDTSYYGRVPSVATGTPGLSSVQAKCGTTSYSTVTAGGGVEYTPEELEVFETGDFTCEAFLYNTGTTDGVIFARMDNTPRGWRLRFTGSLAEMIFQNINPGGDFYSVRWDWSMPANTAWTKVTLVKTGVAGVALYRDGVLLTPTSITGTPELTIVEGAPFRLFRDRSSGGILSWRGYADEVRVFSRALDDSEITADCEEGDTQKVTLADETLEDVVDALCERAGLPAGSWDATALASITKPVRALAVSQVTPIRTVLEQLAAAYFFDCFLADKLYFVPRGGAVKATVPAEDLGCGEERPAEEALPKRVGNDTEIPAQIALSYANANADYNTATEHSDRLLSAQLTTNTVQVPMAFTSAEAKGIVDAMLADAFAGRVTGEAALGLQYARHTPTDVLTLTDNDGGTYRGRLVRVEHAGPLVKCEWVLDDASALTSAGLTSTDYAPALTVALPGPTRVEPLDIPILRDADDAPGIYVALKPTTASWPGAKLMTSVAGADYEEVGTATSRAIFGIVTAALTDWTGGNVFDESGSVTVDVGLGELTNATRDQVLDSDANAMLIGSEIIQFRTATLTSVAGIYTLTGLLRGRRGTEWAMTGHTTGERCVLLRTAGLLRVGYDAARIGIEAAYKGVTLGKLLSSAAEKTITDTGIALKPFAPVNLRQNTAVAGQVTITWDRRTRLSARWPATMVPPLGEAAESYAVELLNLSDAVIETQTVSTASATFGLATQQITLDEGVAMLVKIGSYYYGVQQESGAIQILQQDATTGTLTGTSQSLGSNNSWCDLIASGGQLFVTNNALSAGTPSTVLSSVIQRIDPSSLGAVAASYTLPDAGDPYALYHDGTNLWTVGYVSGDLIRLNGTTLASVSATPLEVGLWGIAGDGTWLFFSNYNTGDVFAYEFGAGTPEKWRTAVGGFPQYLHERDGLLYVFTSSSVVVLDATDGSVLHTHAGLASAGQGARPFVDFGSYVAYKRQASQYVVLLDATTGDISAEVQISGILGLAGADGSTLLAYAPAAGREPTSTDLETRGYTLQASLAGFKVRVYQISATVGRGYVAEHTIF